MAIVKYDKLCEAIELKIAKNFADRIILEQQAIRRDETRDKASVVRPAFVRDIEKIMNCPYYNRYTDKTQVFSLYKNDDISRRALHVQLVSRIARNIGRLLGLNLDLIEAIALGHDMGHTPFGHAGESILSKLYYRRTGRYFNHNVHSVRVLDRIFHYNISLQTLHGILCHNGELELDEYRPSKLSTFEEFDKIFEDCYTKDCSGILIPSTLEGCIVRISDIIAYLGKDRQDAERAKLLTDNSVFNDNAIGAFNAKIINNLIVNIVENSYGKDYIKMDEKYYTALKEGKKENYRYIYKTESVGSINGVIEPMFEKIYAKCLNYILVKDKSSVIYKHHIDYVKNCNKFYNGPDYEDEEPNQIVVDYIASMTDDYMIDLYSYLFPDEPKVEYVSYFNDLE